MDNEGFDFLVLPYLRQFTQLSPKYTFLLLAYFAFGFRTQKQDQKYLFQEKFGKQSKTQPYIYFVMTSWQQTNQFELVSHNLKGQFTFLKRNFKDIL